MLKKGREDINQKVLTQMLPAIIYHFIVLSENMVGKISILKS